MEQVPAVAHAVSGAIGGSVANLLLYPLDVAIVRMQVRSDAEAQQRARTPDGQRSARTRSPNVLETMHAILRDEGWPALLNGAGDDLVATALQTLLYFFVYDYLRNRKLRRHVRRRGFAPKTLGIQEELLLGAVAGMFCKLFTTPIKNVVVHKQITFREAGNGVRQYKSVGECVREIVANKGITGLWSGYRATLVLSANPSLSYYFYQVLASRGRETAGRVFMRAAVAKSMATALTYPVILAKTRTQARLTRSRFYTLMWETWRTQGVVGLYEGVNGQLLKGFFTQGITMMTKEKITQLVVYCYLLTRRSRRS